MTKKIILSLILLVSLSSYVTISNNQGKTTLVVYKVGKYIDSSQGVDNSKKTPIDEQLKFLEYNLIYNTTSSLFFPIDVLGKDDDFEFQFAKMLAGGICFKNYETKEKIEQIDSFGEILNVYKPIDEYKWEITKESKEIQEFVCYKAITKKVIYNEIKGVNSEFNPVVWFCPKIPASFGPKGLDGLPGLVLEGTFNAGINFYATKIDFDYKGSEKLEKPTKGKYVSEEELSKIVTKSVNDTKN